MGWETPPRVCGITPPSPDQGAPGGLGMERGGTQPQAAWVYSTDEMRHMHNKEGKTTPHRPAFKGWPKAVPEDEETEEGREEQEAGGGKKADMTCGRVRITAMPN